MTTVSRLEQIVGPNRLLTEPEDPVPYSFDATPVLNQLPQAVVSPKQSMRLLPSLSSPTK